MLRRDRWQATRIDGPPPPLLPSSATAAAGHPGIMGHQNMYLAAKNVIAATLGWATAGNADAEAPVTFSHA